MKVSRVQVVELENKLIEAIKSSDVDFLNEILHNDLLFMIPNGQIITKADDLASHRAKRMIVEKIESTIELINIIDDTAVVVVVYDTKGQMLGNPIEGKFRYIRIWKLSETGLKVIAGSSMQL
jgi:hypothetical protein